MANELGSSTTTKPGEVYKPFPFFGNQIILAAERIHLHAKEDSVLMFARRSIGLSSLGTLNFDAEQKVTINCKKIYLGIKAVSQEEPIIKGKTFTRDLGVAMQMINEAGKFLRSCGDPPSGAKIIAAGELIMGATQKIVDAVNSKGYLSVVSYTE